MKRLSILLFLILTANLIAQDRSIIKQITNVDGDARNGVMVSQFFRGYVSGLFFEFHKDSTSNIFRMEYDLQKDDFSDPEIITNDSCLNINPVVANNFLFFQTNKNGNWDIAYKIFLDSTWSETKYAINTLYDEKGLKFIPKYPVDINDDSVRIMYNRNDTTFLLIYRDSSFISEAVFEDSDSIKYSQVFIYYYVDWGNYSWTIAAAKETVAGKSYLVSKRISQNGVWDKTLLVQDTNANNPKFFPLIYYPDFFYERLDSNYQNIFIETPLFGQPELYRLRRPLFGDISDINVTKICPIVAAHNKLSKSYDYDIGQPHTFKYFIKDSMFISVSKYFHSHIYGSFKDTFDIH